jgi:glycosyltransferase involved in cell wall biosynthesis
MKLVFHVPSLIGGGAERVWVLMASELARRGHDTTLLVWNGEGPNARHVGAGVRVVDFGIPILPGDRIGKPATIKGLVRMAAWLRAERPDAVFSAPEFANLVTAAALTLAGSKAQFFPSFHAAAAHGADGLGSRLAQVLAGLMARRATRLIAVSDGIARDLAARGIARDRISVIHNPLPPTAIAEREMPDWAETLADARATGIPVIVTAGRLAAVKDQATLVQAFARLRARMPAKLAIFGDGPLRADLEAQIRSLGLTEDVVMPGFVTQPADCFAHADLFVLTSRTEGFGNVLVEAMAAGVPVVSTDCPHGPREILENGSLGRLVPVGDVEAIAAAMAETLGEPVSANLLKARAAEFTIDRIGDRYGALIAAA